MIPVGPDPPSAAEGAVHGAGEADGEAANATRQGAPILRFGDEMHVIVLHGELDDPEVTTARRGEGAAHRREDAARAEAAEGGDCP